MRILITGGAGFIGSHLVESFQGEAEIRVLDNLSTGYCENLQGFDCELITASVTNREQVREAVQGVDYVFHLAAMVSVPKSVERPEECENINTLGTQVMLEEAAAAGVKKFCFSSSAAIYGDDPTVPKLETMEPRPKSPYASTKLAGEKLCHRFHDEGRLSTASLRYFNVFGPRQDPSGAYAAAVPIFIYRALGGENITIYGDGQQTRDFIHVKDVVAANRHLAMVSEAGGVFNVASGRRMTIGELADRVIRLTGSSSKVIYGPPRAGDVKHSMASVHKLKSVGFIPEMNFEEGLRATLEFFRGR